MPSGSVLYVIPSVSPHSQYSSFKAQCKNVILNLKELAIRPKNAMNQNMFAGSLNVRIAGLAVAVHPDHHSLTARINTFKNWPEALAAIQTILAVNGFFYSGESDNVVCWVCGVKISGWWTQIHKFWPFALHILNSPNCDLLQIYERSPALLKYFAKIQNEIDMEFFDEFLKNSYAPYSEVLMYSNYKACAKNEC